MYESPLTMYMSDIQTEIQKQQEEEVMVSVKQSIGYDVDKLELIKALQYDRDQYTKGYSDCKIDMLAKIKHAKEEIEDRIDNYPDRNTSEYEDCLTILDKLIAESEGVND